jgi:uncharacterized protein
MTSYFGNLSFDCTLFTNSLTSIITMPSATLPTPAPDDLEDLIYFSRTGDLESLRSLISQLCSTHACPPSILLASAIDIDADGLGSQSSLLHYPAANGNIKIVKYLLDHLTPSESAGEHATTADKSAPNLVNHKNVSGNTPLHWAGMNGNLDVVKLLVGAGADAGIRNEAGRDAVVETEFSAKEGSKECAEWMLKNCAGLEKGLEGARESEGEPLPEEAGATNGETGGDAPET